MAKGDDSFSARLKSRGEQVRARAKQGADLLARGAQNALEVARLGRLTPAQRTPYSVEHEGRIFELRRYAAQPSQQRIEHPVLLVPALMVRSDVYDLEPNSSAVAYLARAGVD